MCVASMFSIMATANNYQCFLCDAHKAAQFVASVCTCLTCPVEDVCGVRSFAHCVERLEEWMTEEAEGSDGNVWQDT